MGFEIRRTGGRNLALSGEFDLTVTHLLLDAAANGEATSGDYVLDLRDVTFIDSSGIRAIVALALESRCGVEIRSPRPNVRRILDLTNVEGHAGIRIVDG